MTVTMKLRFARDRLCFEKLVDGMMKTSQIAECITKQ